MSKITLVKLHKYKVGNPTRYVWKLVWWGLRDGARTRFKETIGFCREMTKKDAELLRAAKEIAIGSHQISPNKGRRMGLAEYLEFDQEEAATHCKPKTIEELRTAAKHAIRVLGADYTIQRVSYTDAQRMKRNLAARGLAPATIGKVIRKLQGAFSRAIQLELIAVNPFKGVKLPKWQDKPIRTYKREEVEAMIEVAPTIWWKAFIELAYTSGLREGELLNLLWSDLAFDASEVRVAPKKARIFTVAGETFPILAWDAKDYENRTIPIPDTVVALLRRLKAKSGGSEYVFLSRERLAAIRQYMAEHDGKLHPSYKLVNNLLRDFKQIQAYACRRLAKQTGHDDYVWDERTIHDLRRTFGSDQAQVLAIHELKGLMGHSAISTTQRYYLAPSENLAERVRSRYAKAEEA